jgi:VanZ family protein
MAKILVRGAGQTSPGLCPKADWLDEGVESAVAMEAATASARAARSARSRRRERWLWATATALLLLGYSLIAPAQQLLNALRARGLLAKTVSGIFLAAGVVLAVVVWRSRPRWSELALYAVVVAVYVLLLSRLEVVQERVHFLQYGVFGGLVFAALRERATPGLASVCLATLITGLAGWGDEGIQSLVPNRVYDLRDVGFNTLAGAMAVSTLAAREILRRPRGPQGPQAISTASE